MRETSPARKYPELPLIAVGGVLLKNGKVLLVKRKNEPGKGLWSIPGGLVEPNETLRDAVKRELREETGLDVEPLRVIHVAEVVEKDSEGRTKYHYVIVDHLCRIIGGTLRPGDDAKEVRWVSLSRAKELPITDTTRKLLEELTKGFFLVIKNRDVSRFLMAVPKGHKHIRAIIELKDGSLIVLHEATMENIARAVVEVELHPRREAILLKGVELEERKEGYGRYQLMEVELPDEAIKKEVTRLLGMDVGES